ncbi:hypothetical protein IGI04_014250, partial [Brassica rapa subsp. trilocularis]
DGPPGFPPLFPELPINEQRMAMTYRDGATYSAPPKESVNESEAESSHSLSVQAVSTPLLATTDFQIGTSMKDPSAGTNNGSKKARRRPPSWKRRQSLTRNNKAQGRMADMEGFEDLVRRSWEGDGTPDARTATRIARCRREMARWKKVSGVDFTHQDVVSWCFTRDGRYSSKSDGGFSRNSVFLNLHYLLACNRNRVISSADHLAFPWILWHIWKARNSFCYEHYRMDPSLVFDKAFEEAETWRGLNSTQASPNHPAEPSSVLPLRWCRPPRNWLKCNVSASWGSHNRMGGAAWIVRDAGGIPLSHSRRAFFGHTSNIEAELQSLLWSIRALIDLRIKWVIIESSLTYVREALLKPHEYPEWRHLIDTIS